MSISKKVKQKAAQALQFATPYLSAPKEEYLHWDSLTATHQYAKGGLSLHRGFFCPSPVYDIVVGNVNRGKLYIRPTAKSQPDYQYGWDSKGRLITVNTNWGSKEFIIYRDDITVSVEFTDSLSFGLSVNAITMCEYDASCRIISYLRCSCDPQDATKFTSYHLEEYSYKDQLISAVDFFEMFDTPYNPHRLLISHTRYFFQHDEDGFLSKYTVEKYSGENDMLQQSTFCQRSYLVYIKRKV